MAVIVGTSGYQYADWVGPFYPAGTARDRMLSYYATQFDAVEINYTYYGMPSPRSAARMVAETPPGFLFAVKLNRALTHEVEEESVEEVATRFREGIAPMVEAGRLAALLAQFPNSFRDTLENRRHLVRLREMFEGLPLAVEFRNAAWQKDPVFDLLAVNRMGYCCVDLPALRGLPDRRARYTAEPAYVRFHSRNARNWYGGRESRYDYSYGEEELAGWVPKVRALAGRAGRVLVFFNNCHAASAAGNALVFRRLLGLM